MFDVGFWELLIIAVVLLLVLGPERLPEVAKQAAFFVRKARQGIFRIRSEMRSELGGDPFEDLEEARREVANLKNDMKQFGRDLSDSHEADIAKNEQNIAVEDNVVESKESVSSKPKKSKKRVSKKATSKKKTTKKTNSKKSATKKKTAKKTAKKTLTKKTNSKKKA